jgi:hypothetical protein
MAKNFITSLILLGYMSLAVFGILAVGQVHQHVMNKGGDHCPFLAGEQSICTMSLTDHVSAWQSMFMGSIELLLVLAIIVCCGLFFLYLRPHNDSPPRWYTSPLYEQFTTTLFSNGILHSKAF